MTLLIKRSDTFFMAACKFSYHSFLCLGVRNVLGEDMVLIDVGKRIPTEAIQDGMHYVWRGICSNHFPSEITNERRLIEGRMDGIARPISYTAFEIDYENYTQFLAYLKYINPTLRAYIPIEESEDGNVRLDYLELDKLKAKSLAMPLLVERLAATSGFFSYQSSCRSAVIDFANLMLSHRSTLPGYFFQEFLATTHIRNSQFTDPLFILPASPSRQLIEPDKFPLFIILYQGLKDVIALKDNSEVAHDIFNQLKALYFNKINTNPDLDAVFGDVFAWAEENPDFLNYDTKERCCYQTPPIRSMITAVATYYHDLGRTDYDEQRPNP